VRLKLHVAARERGVHAARPERRLCQICRPQRDLLNPELYCVPAARLAEAERLADLRVELRPRD